MKTEQLTQGSPEWIAYRASHFNASDAPAMMGVSPYKTRSQLLRELHTGVAPAPEIDIATAKRFENGHRAEALARPLAEEIIGDELYPVTGSQGRYSASFDGVTLALTDNWEHKALNAELRAAFADMQTIAPEYRERASFRCLPMMHRVQIEHQFMVNEEAERTLFMASEWDAEGNLVEERDCWCYPDMKLRAEIAAGWEQFERDLAAYVLPESAEPAPVGKAPETLPALRIEVTGQVTASNLAEFKSTALAAIRSVNKSLSTDADFADAEKAVKWCADVEDRLKAAKEHALSQTSSIDALFKAIDDISAEARRVRLDLDKLVTRRKTEVKEEAVASARKAFDLHVAVIHSEIAPMRLPAAAITSDFAGAIKGLKSFASMQDKLDGALASAKIAADAAARAIRANVATFKERAAGHEFLFADLGQIIHYAADHFAVTVQWRIEAHKAAEAKRIEAERERIRAEEAARLEREAKAKADADAARQAAEAAEAVRVAAAAAVVPPSSVPAAAAVAINDPALAQHPTAQANAASWPSVKPATPRADEPATLNLGAICERLRFTVSAAFLAETLHIQPARIEKASRLYTERQFGEICVSIREHVMSVAAQYRNGVAA